MADFTVKEEDKYYEYHGEEWKVLQNGKYILFAKKKTLMDFEEDTYILLCDKNIKDRYSDISNVDRIFIKKDF